MSTNTLGVEAGAEHILGPVLDLAHDYYRIAHSTIPVSMGSS